MDSDRAVRCNMCDLWVHVICDPLLSDSLYDDMTQHSTDDQWYCSQHCMVCSGNFNRSPQLSPIIFCAVINECSIVGKKFDLTYLHILLLFSLTSLL